LYGKLNNLNFYTSVVGEQPTKSVVGPTYAHVIVDQFKRSRDGDRWWFENEDNVPVTLEGCFQFCQVNSNPTPGKGCKSYYFHQRVGLKGSTSCDLYGASVSSSLEKVDDSIDGVWFDLGCGDPLQAKYN